MFTHCGKQVTTLEQAMAKTANGMSGSAGQVIRVRPNDLHGGVFGPAGGVFQSVQMWLNGIEPRCVGSDYIGLTMGPKHNSQVVTGNPLMPGEVIKASECGAL